jgi:hypothetical protein
VNAPLALDPGMQAALAAARAARAAHLDAALLALLGSAHAAETIAQEWPSLLGLEACSLIAERPVSAAHWRALPAGRVALLLAGQTVRLREGAGLTDRASLHGEAAALVARDALLFLPLPCRTPALLALAARDPAALPARDAAGRLAFLGRAAAAALGRA